MLCGVDWHTAPRCNAAICIASSRVAPASHDGDLVWQIHHGLDLKAMSFAQYLIGRHDLPPFDRVTAKRRTIKTIDEILFMGCPPHWSRDYVAACSFMHNQVTLSAHLSGGGTLGASPSATAWTHATERLVDPWCSQGLHLISVAYQSM